ncbi:MULTISPECIES: LysR substrate-binding domain-containing protein [unclassified Vibrio]|uniref:LysR substrate-binding domain-containing protein n=1 Tax=unclassified Vibrio TaxID=2614977 RepID=UPI00148221DF|nr:MULTISPECIES: LysR substrate-binding domain-containing protein [unclassified Vibrio]MDQ2191865.1 LysR family transcriptional regulator [Vibrio sp. A14(2019)]MDQ2195599.1 LysR family transcriptional regulator [Vibrio sp. 2017_1457_11]NNN76911.1 LysR family transcriptional regulator [Vibrio sp. B7]NNN93472.1 LysR family transcriptional regulator [Vibrio sp. B8-1]NNO06640.1 LysR family transcriptional regulator [Vibrio sp. B4-12]
MKGNTLSILSTFVKVAQYNSFSEAAKSLHLTTGAISQQLILLEQKIGFKLFERHSRGIRLTDEGRTLARVVKQNIQDIESTIAYLNQSRNINEIKLKSTPSFAFKWLVPRLENFHRKHPDIQIQIFAEGALVDSDRRDYDLAIDYGPLPYKKMNAELLFEEYLLPVMSAAYLQAHPQLQHSHYQQESWNGVVLLHDAMPWANASRDYEWLYWASEMGVDIATQQGHFFNRTDMAMSAAEAGVGVAMARMALIDNELETERLVSPFKPLKANAGYYLIHNGKNDCIAAFIRWLNQQT